MEGIPAEYLGRIVSKENFRVFIYSSNGTTKLVNSWDEYERHMETGLWFASLVKDDPPSGDEVQGKSTKVKRNGYNR